MDVQRETIQELLDAWAAGDQEAFRRVIPWVYAELRLIARRANRGENPGNTLQTTALVHEVVVRMLDDGALRINSTRQLYGFMSRAIRNILVDAARRRKSFKRGGDRERVPLDLALGVPGDRSTVTPEMALALDAALTRLARISPRQAEVVELRFFSGLTHLEVAQHLGLKESTIRGDWAAARRFLAKELAEPE